ncbi:tRNA (adenosine(37)-N6)-threonylcarbamoyltransferase complex ATPase subunit type 1 TsaE [Candidatus Synechococcus calcipolaris G9]|uniref:tRNA threonylcarbamoyladenosine biosynthesis protein TsaE n=1 Tax=Candidatus Synechococcus calcipolaris G9 TaxID=1497997 RepID=A0ABT6EUK8_9SYNE|nr:tRNA (adenosine(37)-N6)-threonylcarbamoyltransferase complex ATPase subunit type 1 TsaE [Candidatus Synechococcus calcipolaris]MDG2989546.1 tRNA (adenosine(37)-N6)-threonylcarbamoyltransferase complex ATPase subunit type 1 TsaE [Candidatus Synechococcus calcipolaris G9]
MGTHLPLNLDLPRLQQLGRHWGKALPAGAVVLIYGDLGAGKTTLVQSIGEGLGITEPIQSPTFSLIQEYLEGRIPLYHFDLYRLLPQEVRDLHPELYWQGEEVAPGIVVIEWPEYLPDLPEEYLKVELVVATPEQRRLTLSATTLHQPLLPNLLNP